MRKKILYIRSGPYQINYTSYNLQEVGLAKAFSKIGYDVDILYYSKKNSNQVICKEPTEITILWRKGLKLLRSGLYPDTFKKSFLQNYDVVFVSEYSQITSFIVSFKHNNVYLYNGPYYNLFKIKFMEPIYDFLFCKRLNRNLKKVFCKTYISQEYISKKGLTNSIVTGVGIDIEKYLGEINIEPETKKIINIMTNHKNILYVGSISKRKNIAFLINVFIKLKNNYLNSNLQLVLVGKGDSNYIEYCKKLIPNEMKKDIIWCPFIKNAQMKYVYDKSDVFWLASLQEIFGMVLLESMYFSLPAITSASAGANTLIEDGKNGFIVQDFSEEKWLNETQYLLSDDNLRKKIGLNAHNTIVNNFMWDSIVNKMIKCIQD